mmetsp:Transcript_8106/g.7191  ORF Transcript_8106/g.7191 Transcript_8106/m.7191 type:complete len:181 (-) Transcript_8106:18-560(-)
MPVDRVRSDVEAEKLRRFEENKIHFPSGSQAPPGTFPLPQNPGPLAPSGYTGALGSSQRPGSLAASRPQLSSSHTPGLNQPSPSPLAPTSSQLPSSIPPSLQPTAPIPTGSSFLPNPSTQPAAAPSSGQFPPTMTPGANPQTSIYKPTFKPSSKGGREYDGNSSKSSLISERDNIVGFQK